MGRDVDGLQAFLERYSEAPEVMWTAAVAWIERAAADARAASGRRWRHYPQGEIRRLRRELAGALMLARLAAAMQEEENSLERELLAGARAAGEEQRRRSKREQTRAAEKARRGDESRDGGA